MPTYEYACRDCGERLEAVQAFTDDPLSVCPACGGSLRKVFNSVGIAFKGSGFYRNDSRSGSSKSSSSSPSGEKSTEKSTADSSSSSDSKASDSKVSDTKGSGAKESSTTSSAAAPA
jgi:putative FmdB family regulatory protein